MKMNYSRMYTGELLQRAVEAGLEVSVTPKGDIEGVCIRRDNDEEFRPQLSRKGAGLYDYLRGRVSRYVKSLPPVQPTVVKA